MAWYERFVGDAGGECEDCGGKCAGFGDEWEADEDVEAPPGE